MKNHTAGESGKIWNRKLSIQIAGTVTVVSLIILSLLTVFVSLTLNSIIKNRVMSEFSQIAEINGNTVQNMLDSAEKCNDHVENYLLNNYYKFDNGVPSGDPRVKDLFNWANLTTNQVAAFKYYRELMESSIYENETFCGMGIYFEPYAFNNNVDEFSTYIYRESMGSDTLGYLYAESYQNEEWYATAIETGLTFITEPYEEDGEHLIGIATPLTYEGINVGVVLVDIYTEKFSDLKSSHPDFQTMSSGLLNSNCNYIYNSISDQTVGKHISTGYKNPKDFEADQKRMSSGEGFVTTVVAANGNKIETFLKPVHACGTTWWSFTSIATRDLYRTSRIVTVIMLAATVVSLIVLACICTMQIIRKLKPLTQLNEAAAALKQGDLSYQITYNSQNEIGEACNSIREGFDSMRVIINELSRLMAALEKCNLTVLPDMNFPGDFAVIHSSYMTLLETLNAGFQEIKLSAEQINIGADQVSSAAQTLSQGSSEQAASVEELSAMITDVAEKIKSNAKGATEANDLSVQVEDGVKQSSQYMSDLMKAMERITESSQEVNKIIKTIDDIAFQTNILALNAAVEAARAGSAGKGFAVVADEVRNLAAKSAEAAKSTTALIEGEIAAVQEGTGIANLTSDSLNEVVGRIGEITKKVQNIAQFSSEQAVAVEQINTGAEQISAVIQANSATSEESAAASEELAGQANMLDSLVKQFKLQDDSSSHI